MKTFNLTLWRNLASVFDKVAHRGIAIAAGAVIALAAPSVARAQATGTYTFEQGLNGYTNSAYSTIKGSAPTAIDGPDWQLLAFGTPNNANQQVGLLQFNDIFGTGPGQVNLSGLTIVSATLSFYNYSDWTPGTGNGSITVDPMLTAWSPSTVTDAYAAYNSTTSTPTAYWGGGSSAAVGPQSGIDFNASLGSTAPLTAAGTTVSVDITSIVQAWQSGTIANNGVALFGGGTYLGMQAYSPATGAGNAPTLTIVTEASTQAIPEPSTWALLFGGCALLFFYQRRRRQS